MAATINISLPEPLKTYVDAQVEDGIFKTADEYISDLIANDLNQRDLEQHLAEALADESKAIEIPEHIMDCGDIVAFLEEQAHKLR